MLAAHEEIATTSEPWVLLPFLYTLRDRGTYAEYEHSLATRAIGEFIEVLPEGRQEYLSEMRKFVLRLYARAAFSGARYFLDKTPRYDLIVQDIIDLFPEGKFIFLWRNPLSVAASLIETPWGGWGARRGGRWNLYRFKTDLYDGLENLIGAYQRYSTVAHALRYEDLVASPTQELTRVLDYMDLPFDPAALNNFGMVELPGGYKDPTGIQLYKQVSREPLGKWKQTLANPIRRTWCRRYLRWIGAERLRTMGYSLEELLAELDSIPTSSQQLASDALRAGYGLAHALFEPAIFKDKLRLLPDWRRIHRHH
jgi:Sulfotransferase family